ncbi:polyribonucleotide nucleotidyltransferase [Streptococcus pneumoniae]|nr:polyribonucleotide nucleotidyltransferase [Streptococcus pneumoniae]
MAKQVFQTTFAGRELIVETGQVAKQANGSVVVRYGESTVLTAAVMSKKMATGDFFPLQVNYEEKMYAAGKFPGGFMKREGRPSTDATLTARLIDRPIRPMFAEGFRNEVQVINTVLSYDENASAPMAAMFGSSGCGCRLPSSCTWFRSLYSWANSSSFSLDLGSDGRNSNH